MLGGWQFSVKAVLGEGILTLPLLRVHFDGNAILISFRLIS
jgi:hypothetical protein